ncbi:hypothetical protein TWF706_003037 [Orbilia oligospora]|nr:hypothetical protein TWF706_003037 [Orbilia oligospora]
MVDLLQFGIDINATSDLLDVASYDTYGFAEGFPFRKYKFESLADGGTDRCRSDWVSYVGPVEVWGNHNPSCGNLVTLLFPMCKPERMALVSYIFEFGFLYDGALEASQNSSLDINTRSLSLNETEHRAIKSVSGTKQIQAKILLELVKVDPVCAEVVIGAWQRMVLNTAEYDKSRIFHDFEEYIDFRIIDAGILFSCSLALFGMAIELSDKETNLLADIVRPCFAALSLTNDYFSFEVEYREFLDTGADTLVNCVWLFMQWEKQDVEAAKNTVRRRINEFERDFLRRREELEKCYAEYDPRLLQYLESLFYTIAGNVIWSSTCPRYNPELALTSSQNASERRDTQSLESDAASETETDKCVSSVSSTAPSTISDRSDRQDRNESGKLDTRHLLAPYKYLTSMPSKGVREAFVDSLNLWLDDLEDNSPLRRGKDAAHVIYGDAQTINSANYLIVWAMDHIRKLRNPTCMDVFFEEIQNSLIGQSYELEWRESIECPLEDEYLEMVDKNHLAVLVGRYFQIRDDLMNLIDNKYTDQKGFCEDLDEGKFSYLVLHAWRSAESEKLHVLFRERKQNKAMTRDAKEQVLDILRTVGSFEYTEKQLSQLEQEIDNEVNKLEDITGKKNWSLRLLLHKLTTRT